MGYKIEVAYKNQDDEKCTTAGHEGDSIEEMLYDIIFFLSKTEYYCKNCKKKHKIKPKCISINFNTK